VHQLASVHVHEALSHLQDVVGSQGLGKLAVLDYALKQRAAISQVHD
jgi:hypothetical protein